MRKVWFLFLFVTVSLIAENSSIGIDGSSFVLISGNSNPELSQEVADLLGVKNNNAIVERFNDGEIKIQIEESIRGKDVFILQSACPTKYASINDNLMELYLLIRACKRASVNSITAVIPYFSYARQDRKMEGRVPISASDVASLIEDAGADHVIAFDLHCGQIQGFFHNISVDNLLSTIVFMPYLRTKNFHNLVVVAPDAGAVKRAKDFIAGLHKCGIEADFALIIKQRLKAGEIEKMTLIGNVEGSDILIVDDICDTGGTLIKAAEELKNHGARKIYACITHPVFSKNALEKIEKSCFDELIVTNTIPLRDIPPPNVIQISIAPLIAETIYRSYYAESISDLFNSN